MEPSFNTHHVTIYCHQALLQARRNIFIWRLSSLDNIYIGVTKWWNMACDQQTLEPRNAFHNLCGCLILSFQVQYCGGGFEAGIERNPSANIAVIPSHCPVTRIQQNCGKLLCSQKVIKWDTFNQKLLSNELLNLLSYHKLRGAMPSNRDCVKISFNALKSKLLI